MSIRMVEPDLKDPLKARHVFECQECGLLRDYLIDRLTSHLTREPHDSEDVEALCGGALGRTSSSGT